MGTATVNISVPATRASGFGGNNNASVVMPSTRLSAEAHDSTGENSANLTLGSDVLLAYGGANAILTTGSASISSAGTVTSMASASMTLKPATISASGRVSGIASASLGLSVAQLVGYSGAVLSTTLAPATMSASASAGAVASAAIEVPMFDLVATGTRQNSGNADLILPSAQMGGGAVSYMVIPGTKLVASGYAVVAATYEAYAINLNHSGDSVVDETTRYTNFPFTHVVRHKNSYYGVNGSGLYLLAGTTDTGTPVTWNVKTAMTDFGTGKQKRVESAYFTGRMGPASTITAYPGEDASTAYAYTTPRGNHVQNHRQVFGKGMKGTFFSLGASGSGELALDNIELNVTELSRRI